MTTQHPQPLPPGTTLARGKYTIEQVLGQGGFGYVYRARERGGQPCAIKQCTDLTSAGLVQFGHEVAVQRLLTHRAFVRFYAQFVEKTPVTGQGAGGQGAGGQGAGGQGAGGQGAEALFTVMEYVPGQSLDDLLADRLQQNAGSFPEADAVAWTVQILDALQHAHAVGVIHRDIKPGNILLLPGGQDKRGSIKIIDFGIAKIGGAGAQTLYGARGISPPYSPPEQYSQNGQTAAYSDIYAVGATLYHLVTGEAPTDAPVRQSGQTLPMPRRHNPALSARIEGAILRAMQLNVADRYQDAAEMLAALQGQPPAVRGPHAARPAAYAAGSAGASTVREGGVPPAYAAGSVGASTVREGGAPAAYAGGSVGWPLPFRPQPALPAALRALRSLPELVRWCDGHWWDAVRLLRGGELAAAITELGQFRQGRARRRGVELSPVLLAQVQQAAALPDENLALETVLRTLGAPPPRPRHNWRALERALGLGWLPDGRWLWPWWSGPGGLTFVVQNRGRGYLHGRIDALVPWLEVPQPEFGCLAGQQQRIPLHLTGRRRLAGLAPEILALHVD